MKKIVSEACMFMLLLASCSRQNDGDAIKFEDVSSAKVLLSFVEHIDLVPLQTDDAPLLGSHTELYTIGDSYVVLDKVNKLIVRYGMDGSFLNTVGRRGNGPGEYIDIHNIQLVDDEIIVFSSPDKILHYEAGGDFLYEEHTEGLGTQSWLVNEGLLSYYSFGSGRGHRAGLWTKDKELPFLNDDAKVIHFSGDAPVFWEWGGKIFFTDAYNPSIMLYDNNKVRPIITFDFGNASIPEEFYEFEDAFVATEFLFARKFALIQRYLSNDRYQFLEVLIQHQDKLQTRYGIAQDGMWKWFSVGDSGSSPMAGSFRTMDGQALYGLMDSYVLKKMDRSFIPLILNPEVIDSISPSDNPVLAIITLK